MTENVETYRNQISVARTEIKNLRQQLSSLKHEHLKEIKQIKSVLNVVQCSDYAEQQGSEVTTNCNEAATSRASHLEDVISFQPIGVIETTFQNKRGVPRQPSILAKAKGAVVVNPGVFNNPEHALSGLEEFSHMWIIFHFHATESTNVLAKVAPPRLGGERRGVFSTRSPHRPCPIGLSLVKIHSIEGNKVYFNGVDMVNGTPVLDIKPYIPQYDYPSQIDNIMTMSSLVRPPTEGISDITDNVSTLNVGSAPSDMRSISPRLTHPIGIDTSSPISPSPYDLETSPHDIITPVSPSPDSPSSIELLDGASYMNTPPARRPDTERGAPDGQERFTPPQSAQLVNLRHDGIRVAPWISNPPSQTYEVRFSDDALNRLNELIGTRAPAFKSTIEALLSEDPRSQYVRTRYPDHEYSCVLEDLSLSCVFDSSTSLCTIIAVRSAEDLQN